MSIIELAKDPYERKARVFPGLLVVLPLLVPLLCSYGPKHPILTSVVGLVTGCGTIYMLASVARGLGKKLEKKLNEKWGGMPTTISLRHRDKSLDSVSKKRYHDAISSELGIAMPSAQEEQDNPDHADDTYIGATKRLREITRSNKELLLKENIAYGFHRNMLAMKPIGIASCIAGIIYGLLIARVLQVTPPHFNPLQLADPGLAAGLTLLISLALLAAWIFYFNEDSVKHMGFTYAERLFECLPSLSSPPPSKK